MLNRIILILFLVLLNLSFLLGQRNKVLFQYMGLVNKAELSICDDNLDLALQLYRQAFDTKTPFVRDLYNAWLVAIHYKDTTYSVELYNRLLQKHFNRKMPIYDKKLEYLKNDSYWAKPIQKAFEEGDLYVEQYRLNAAKELWDILIKDQAIRKKYYNEENIEIKDSLGIEMWKIDSLDLLEYIEILKKNNLPDDTMGYGDPRGVLPQSEILTHNYKLGRTWANDYFISCINQGRLDPRRFVPIWAQFDKRFDYPRFCYINTVDSVIYKIANNTLKENIARYEFYLESVEEYEKKVLYNLKHPEYAFYSFMEVPIIDGAKENDPFYNGKIKIKITK